MTAAMWPISRQREYDANGNALVGAQAFFFDTETTTPQQVYQDADLSVAHDQPVLTDGYGRWPAVFLNSDPGEYRQRVLDPDDVVLFDDDGIIVPLAAAYTPPDAGDTSTDLLFQTGDLKVRYGTGTLTGYVRCNGRTVGSAASGASERANADCEDLFEHLWTADANLSVSGGRGANAPADWAANKTIALPDWRDRAIIGLGGMGNSDAGRIADSLVDGSGTNTTLGATVGASTVTLTEAQMPAHTHTATFTGNALPAHSHTVETRAGDGPGDIATGDGAFAENQTTSSTSAGTPSGTISVSTKGSSASHTNMQPSMFATIYIKL